MRKQRTEQQQGTVRKKIATAAIAVGVVLFGIAVAPGVASAHHPVLSGTTSCRTGDTWTVNWTATSANWKNYWTINTSGWSPGGWQSWTTAFTRSISYPASQGSATTTVSASWSNSSDGSNPVHDNETSGPVKRPPLCPVDTTTTTTTSTTTTTTQPEVTTTQPEVTTTQPGVTTTQPEVTTTQPGVTTTQPEVTTTVAQTTPTTPTTLVGQEGPTSTVDQSSGAAATTTIDPVGRTLPATGNSSTSLVVIALTMIGIGAVMLRFATRSTR